MWMAAIALMGATFAHGAQADGPPPLDAAPLVPGTATIEVMAEGQATPTAPRTMADRAAVQQEVAVRQSFANALETALSNQQFTMLPSHARGRYIVRFTIDRTEKGAVASGGSGAQASAWGGSIGVTLGTGKSQMRGLIVTTLSVELVARATDEVVWQGQALTAQAANSREDTPQALAAKLAPAVIRSFPQSLAEPVSVP